MEWIDHAKARAALGSITGDSTLYRINILKVCESDDLLKAFEDGKNCMFLKTDGKQTQYFTSLEYLKFISSLREIKSVTLDDNFEVVEVNGRAV